MELLILKSESRYIRVKENTYHLTGLDKASVFPIERLDVVKQHETQLRKAGFPSVSIKKLVLTEEEL